MNENNKKSLYYITQYADYMTDGDVYNLIEELTEKHDLEIDLFVEIAELMTSTDDKINAKLFNKMLEVTDDSDLQYIIDLLTAIDNEDINEIDTLTDNALSDYMSDYNIQDAELWDEIADYDLKENGIDASCLYWVKDINYHVDYLQLNGYENGFNEMTTEEVITEFMEYYL